MSTSSCFSHNKKIFRDTVSMQDGYWKISSQSFWLVLRAFMPVEFPEFNLYHSQVCSLGHENNLFLFHLQSVSKFTGFSCDSFTSWSAILVVTFQKSSIMDSLRWFDRPIRRNGTHTFNSTIKIPVF